MSRELSDEHVKARIASMTMQERRELVEACEHMWNGTSQPWMAAHLRALFEQARAEPSLGCGGLGVRCG